VSFSSLHHHFLIAMPTLGNDLFYQSVIYICEHTQTGATGIIINQPLDLRLNDILERMKIVSTHETVENVPVLQGGPLHTERGFVLHQDQKQWRSTFTIADNLSITTSRDVLEDIAAGNKPHQNILITLGYSGWDDGQLEEEIAKNYWLVVPANTKILFETPFSERWKTAAALLGIDINQISNFSGHG